MKKNIPILAFFLFLNLAACTGADLSTAQMANAVKTLTATVLPPTVTTTPDPDESAIVLLLNYGLTETGDPLSQTVDAKYQVIDVSFPPDANNKASVFSIRVRCECVNRACSPERTFVVIVNAMKPVADKIARQVPPTVRDVQVSCFDHTSPVGTVVVSWRDMTDYFTGKINGFQLGGRTITLAGQ